MALGPRRAHPTDGTGRFSVWQALFQTMRRVLPLPRARNSNKTARTGKAMGAKRKRSDNPRRSGQSHAPPRRAVSSLEC